MSLIICTIDICDGLSIDVLVNIDVPPTTIEDKIKANKDATKSKVETDKEYLSVREDLLYEARLNWRVP